MNRSLKEGFRQADGIFTEPVLGIHYDIRYGAINPVDPFADNIIKNHSVLRERKRFLNQARLTGMKKDEADRYLDGLSDDEVETNEFEDVKPNEADYCFSVLAGECKDAGTNVLGGNYNSGADGNSSDVLGGLVLGGASSLSWSSVLVGILLVVIVIGLILIVYSAAHNGDTVIFNGELPKLAGIIVGAFMVVISGLSIGWLAK